MSNSLVDVYKAVSAAGRDLGAVRSALPSVEAVAGLLASDDQARALLAVDPATRESVGQAMLVSRLRRAALHRLDFASPPSHNV